MFIFNIETPNYKYGDLVDKIKPYFLLGGNVSVMITEAKKFREFQTSISKIIAIVLVAQVFF